MHAPVTYADVDANFTIARLRACAWPRLQTPCRTRIREDWPAWCIESSLQLGAMKIGTRTVHHYVEPATGLLGEIDQAPHLGFNS